MLLVSYDLKQLGRNYQPVLDYLRSYESYCKPLESVFILDTSKSAQTVRDELMNRVDSNDRVFVADVNTSLCAGYNLPQSVTDWLDWH